MKLAIVGLGNPGEKFKNTRHNVGFMVVDKFAEKNNFPEFKLNKKLNALISENENVLLVKPQTFMNESGKSVRLLTKNYTLQTTNYIIVHDDVDLPVGKIKIVNERGSAGHKGVESIIKAIGNEGLVRLRIGISPQKDVKAMEVVLENFSKDEQEIINQTITKAVDALNLFIKQGLESAMNEYNQ